MPVSFLGIVSFANLEIVTMSFYFNYTGDTPSHSWSGFVQRLQTFACLFCCSGEEVVEDWHYQPIKFRFLGLNYYYIENQFNNNQESLLHCLFPWLSSTKWRQWMLWGSGWAGAGQSGAQKTHTQRAAVPCTNLVQAGGAEREGDCLRRSVRIFLCELWQVTLIPETELLVWRARPVCP